LEEVHPPPKVKHTYPELGGLSVLYICCSGVGIRKFLIFVVKKPDFDAAGANIAG